MKPALKLRSTMTSEKPLVRQKDGEPYKSAILCRIRRRHWFGEEDSGEGMSKLKIELLAY